VKWVAAGLCAYEVGAITTGRVPTLTQLSARNRWLGPVLVGALAVHLARARPPRAVDGECVLCPVAF
jgi:hypothetical protein